MANRFLSNISINDAYTFPASDGTSGQVITTDGSGNLSFSNVSSLDGAKSNFVYYDVKNSSGSTINKGTGVMAVGTDGNSGHILIAPMVADGSVEPKFFMGVLETTLLNGEIGKVVHFGQISQINTSTFTDGDVLWCDPANPGGFTITEPLGPNVKIAAAIVINASTNGKIKVRVQGNPGLHELHDVKLVSEVNGDLLQWNGTTGVWENKSLATIADSRYVNVSGDTMTGNLTLQYEYPRINLIDTNHNSDYSIINSDGSFSIYDITNNAHRLWITPTGNIGIGTTTPVRKLHVAGDGAFTSNLEVGYGNNGGENYLQIGTGRTTNGYAYIDLIGDATYTDYGFRILRGNIGANAGSDIIHRGTGDFDLITSDAASLVFKTYSAERMRINSDGNIGIGTSDFGLSSYAGWNNLRLGKTGNLFFNTATNTYGFAIGRNFYFASDASYKYLTTDEAERINFQNGEITFSNATSGTEDSGLSWNVNMVLDVNGNLGIGTSTPTEKLEVNGNIEMGTNPTLYWHSNTLSLETKTDSIPVIAIKGSTSYFPRLDMYNAGNTTVINRLQTSGDSYINGGNVGIGTSGPTEKLEVVGNIILDAANANLKIKSGAAGTKGDIQWTFTTDSTVYASAGITYDNRTTDGFLIDSGYPITLDYASSYIRFSNNGSEKMRLDTSGNLGIGMTSIAEKLSVKGDTGIYGTTSGGIVTPANLVFYNSEGGDGIGDGVNILNHNIGNIQFYGKDTSLNAAGLYASIESYIVDTNTLVQASQNEGGRLDFNIWRHDVSTQPRVKYTALTIDNYANVGIGTSSPNAGLHVYSSGNGELKVERAGGALISLQAQSTLGAIGTDSNHPLYLKTNAGTRLAITTAGNVGIGITLPTEKLSIASGNISMSDSYSIKWGNNYLTGLDSVDALRLFTAGYERIRIDSSGFVGIGTTTPSEKLEVTGNAKVTGSLSVQNVQYANGDILAVSENGTLTKISKDNAAEFLGVNSKALMQDLSFGESYINNYRSRVLDNTGTYFPTPAGYNFGVLKNKKYLDKTGVVLLPSGVKTGGLFSVKPKNGNGDFDFTRNSTATYVDEDGLIQVAEANVPRLNYDLIDGVVQSTPALLLEPSRTNSLPYSEDFSQASWIKQYCDIAANATTSPDGSVNATKLKGTGLGANAFMKYDGITGAATIRAAAFSIYAKAGEVSWIRITSDSTFNTDAYYDLANGMVGYVNEPTDIATMIDMGNGWYRCILTMPDFDPTATTTDFLIGLATGNNERGTVADEDGVYIWGAQLEDNSTYATSYIPTSGTTVTRAAEVCNGAGTSAEFNDSEGVLFAEIAALADDLTVRKISINNGSFALQVAISYDSSPSNEIRCLVYNGSVIGELTTTSFNIAQNNKVSYKYKSGDIALWVNGFEVGTSTATFSISGLNKLSFNDGSLTPFYGKTKQLIAFNAALTDEQLEDLTSWDSFEELAASQFYTLY